MSSVDYITLLLTISIISFYGVWKTRKNRSLNSYLRDGSSGWLTIGLSVMATQASAITFLSTPGLAFYEGMAFVQNYFGLPLAMIVVSLVFIPAYYKRKVYSAYEYLGHRFDSKTRFLGSGLFLIQRGLAAGITIYAPSIILTNVLHWDFHTIVVGVGVTVILYTMFGGSKAVSVTHKYQMLIILSGMVIAFMIVVFKISRVASFHEALSVAGTLGKLEIIDFSFDINKRYTLWSGLLGGFFLALSYFGTDQSQVQRYLSARSMDHARKGLIFNAMLKVPMQFFILLLGVLVFVFYLINPPPVSFSPGITTAIEQTTELGLVEDKNLELYEAQRLELEGYVSSLRTGDESRIEASKETLRSSHLEWVDYRKSVHETAINKSGSDGGNEADYVFIHFILNEIPRGLVGLLVAVILLAAMSSTASELSALSTISMIDFYKTLINPDGEDTHYLWVTRGFNLLWGVLAVGFALFANMLENLIEAVNIVGSLFYGSILGLFLTAFFFKRVKSNAVFIATILAQTCVIILFFNTRIGYLWFNVIGCVLVLLFGNLFALLKANGAEVVHE